ncbi:hypothetical protein O7635_24870 [Asanoa sp. WMMD1127]|uniref:hypothetical protein n=1 Tax=Asanoa sp. WMMD1127 TaxID=3016107 RepID=UPI002417FFE2|nr:hypothetical protein [Asanoa sp. WMMD1127]MDG4825093.1 hypothetical protein [Asanoa sp. WMMD1127]
MLLVSLTPGAALADSKEIRNTGRYAIGAVKDFDGYFDQGKYDALIPPGRFSGWASTAGIWIGPNYCVRVRYWRSGTEANPPGPAQLTDPSIAYGGSKGKYQSLTTHIGVDVRALPYSEPDCWRL